MNGFEELLTRALAIADIDLVQAWSPIPLSMEMTLLLCGVIFDGYTIGGRSEPGPAGNRKSD